MAPQMFFKEYIKKHMLKPINRSIRINTVSNKKKPILLEGARTPFCLIGTKYIDSTTYEIAATAMRGVIEKNNIPKDTIDYCYFGSTFQDPVTPNIARDALLYAGFPNNIPGSTISIGCASSLTSLTAAVESIRSGSHNTVLVGGVCNISDGPILYNEHYRRAIMQYLRDKNKFDAFAQFMVSPVSWAYDADPTYLEHSTTKSLSDGCEQLSTWTKVSKNDADDRAYKSMSQTIFARQNYKTDVIPIYLKDGSFVDEDNAFNKYSTMFDIKQYEPDQPRTEDIINSSFKRFRVLPDSKEDELSPFTYMNSSPIVDGASAVIVMDESKALSLGVTPKAFIKDYVVVALDTKSQLFLGEFSSLPSLLVRNKLTFQDVGVIEMMEMFGAYLPSFCKKIMDNEFMNILVDPSSKYGYFDPEVVNTWGGSLGIGNAFSANGTRLVSNAINRMHFENSKYGIVTSVTAGGMAISILLEKY